MKNKKLFIVSIIVLIVFSISLPALAEVFYDASGGSCYASAWTYWDYEQPESNIPYLDVYTTVMNINCTHNIEYVTTRVDRNNMFYAEFENYDYGNYKDIIYGVAAYDASLYEAFVTVIEFE